MKEKLLNLRGIRFALAVSLLFLGQTVMAQSTVTGTVSASNGQPIPGVNVMIKGTTKGVSTDVKGTYKISATPQTTLLFTGLGYTEQQILVGAKTTIDVVLTESSQIIEDVVVVGYTPMKRRDLTGAVGSVNSDILATQAQTSAALSLRGQVAGMSVTQSTGQAGADPVIEIRGMSTIEIGRAHV